MQTVLVDDVVVFAVFATAIVVVLLFLLLAHIEHIELMLARMLTAAATAVAGVRLGLVVPLLGISVIVDLVVVDVDFVTRKRLGRRADRVTFADTSIADMRVLQIICDHLYGIVEETGAAVVSGARLGVCRGLVVFANRLIATSGQAVSLVAASNIARRLRLSCGNGRAGFAGCFHHRTERLAAGD